MDMKTPANASWERLKRCARFMKGIQDKGFWFPCDGDSSELHVYTDTDWAGCKRSRNSTTCICYRVGDCTMATQVAGQSIKAQSSGESEFYGGVSGVSGAIGLKHILDFVGMPVVIVLHMDSSAARGVMQRSGVGKIRHLEVKTLWVQQLVHDKHVKIRTVKGLENPSDIGTKVLPAATLEKLSNIMGFVTAPAAVRQVSNIARAHPYQAVQNANQVLQALVVALLATQGHTQQIVSTFGNQVQFNPGVCQYFDGTSLLYLCTTLIILAFAFGAWTYYKLCTGGRGKHPRRQLDKASQAPVTYLRNREQPRFHPLPESSHG